MTQHPKEMKPWLVDETVEMLVEREGRLGSFAGQVAIYVLHKLLRKTIVVFQLGRAPQSHGFDYQETISLAYVGGNHYNAIYEDERICEPMKVSWDDSIIRDHQSEKPVHPEKGAKNHTLTSLLQSHLLTQEATQSWLIEEGLFTAPLCPECKLTMKHQTCVDRGKNRTRWVCKCKKRLSLRGDSIFTNVKLPLNKFVELMIRWLKNETEKEMIKESSLAHTTVERWVERMKLIAAHIMTQRMEMIGGKGRVVEIDEILVKRRKYNKGRAKEQGWVLGGVERPIRDGEKPRVFLCTVPNRTSQTLERIIQKFVHKDTIIVTDAHAGYNGLTSLGYQHAVVNHAHQFVDPLTGVNTQRIEGFWHWLRRDAFSNRGTTMEAVDTYLMSFLYRRQINGDMMKFLTDMSTLTQQDLKTISTRWKNIKNKEKRLRKEQDDLHRKQMIAKQNRSSQIEEQKLQKRPSTGKRKKKHMIFNTEVPQDVIAILRKKPERQMKIEKCITPPPIEIIDDSIFCDCEIKPRKRDRPTLPLIVISDDDDSTHSEIPQAQIRAPSKRMVLEDAIEMTANTAVEFDVFEHIAESQEYREARITQRTMKKTKKESCTQKKERKTRHVSLPDRHNEIFVMRTCTQASGSESTQDRSRMSTRSMNSKTPHPNTDESPFVIRTRHQRAMEKK